MDHVRIRPTLWLNATTPGWFETMGIPPRSGRDFEAGDRVGSRPVAIVNETRRFLPGEQPIGQSVRLGFEPDTRYEIVGVVGDTVYTTPREGMLATMYVAMAQRKPSEFWPTVLLTVNTAPGTRAMVEREVAEALRKADPAIAFTFGTFDQLVEATVRRSGSSRSSPHSSAGSRCCWRPSASTRRRARRARGKREICASRWARLPPLSCVSCSSASAC